MSGFLLSLVFLFIFLYGYYLGIKPSRLERDIRKKNLIYECFKCKKIIDINEAKCPDCNFVTIYGHRKKKYILIIPIILGYLLLVAKFINTGMI